MPYGTIKPQWVTGELSVNLLYALNVIFIFVSTHDRETTTTLFGWNDQNVKRQIPVEKTSVTIKISEQKEKLPFQWGNVQDIA